MSLTAVQATPNDAPSTYLRRCYAPWDHPPRGTTRLLVAVVSASIEGFISSKVCTKLRVSDVSEDKLSPEGDARDRWGETVWAGGDQAGARGMGTGASKRRRQTVDTNHRVGREHTGPEGDNLRRPFWVAGALRLPVSTI